MAPILWRVFATLAAAVTLCSACSKRSAPERAPHQATIVHVPGAPDPNHGRAIFASNCQSCHGVAGAGGGIGPSLRDERSRKSLAETISWIKNPQPPMPKLYPVALTQKDVSDVAAYVQSL